MTNRLSKTSVATVETSSSSSTIPSNFLREKTEIEENRSISIREILLYGLCLIIICAISFGRTNDSTYYFTNMLTKAFVTAKSNNANAFNDIAQNNGADLWKSLQGPIFSRLYGIDSAKSNVSNTDYGYIFTENKILGVARLRQVRVKSNSCALHNEFAKRNFTQGCYAAYTLDNEDRTSFGNHPSNAWHYTSDELTKTSLYKGVVSKYNGGGYIQLFTRSANTTMNILRELERNSWIDRGTRAIFFDVVVYNPNINLFAHIRLLAEYPSSGGAIPSSSIRVVRLIQYTSSIDYLTLICEILFTLLIILQILQCLIEIIIQKSSFFFHLWNLINLTALILSSICILYEIIFQLSTRNYLGDLLQMENDYPNLNQLFTLKINTDFSLGLTLAITWLKIFKYLNLNKTLLLLNKTLSSCLKDLLAFTCIFLIIFLAYTQFGWLLFGRYLTEWRSLPQSIFTLFRMIIGDFDFYAMWNIGEIIGPLFLFSYIFLVYFVLLNMFLAIISETYSRIEADKTLRTFRITGFARIFNGWFFRKQSRNDGMNLKIHGSIDADIEKRIDKYRKDNDGNLDDEEQIIMKQDLDKRQIQNERNHDDHHHQSDITNKVSYDDYLVLNQHVGEIENKTIYYINKIEEVLSNLDDLHKTTINQHDILRNISVICNVKKGR